MAECDDEELLADLVDVFLQRVRAGERLSVEGFVEEHPECREGLLELLPALLDMEGLSRSTMQAASVEVCFPEQLGDYRLLERIGSGGMGTVFRALQVSLNREVAVKVLSPSWNAESRHLLAFENESRVIAALRHTNIVEVFGAGCEGEYRYYVMSLVHGKGLCPELLQRTFPGRSYAQAVAEVGLQAAEGLAFAHEHGVLHRDVKPGNLLLDDQGVLHVSDFGLATVLNASESAPLVTQCHDGTLRYMAPERLLKGENSFACDQYSLGLTLYELLSRRAAFREAEPGQLIRRICSQPIAPLRGEGELGAIVNKCVSFLPGDRYASMRELACDLRCFLRGEPVSARPASCLRRYGMWLRRRPAVAIWSHAAGLLVLLLLVSVSVGYWRVAHALEQENAQRELAEKNAQIADAAMQRIFSSVLASPVVDLDEVHVTKEDARLIQDLMPYYEEIATQDSAQADSKVGHACYVLAVISLRVRDFATAEAFFRRALCFSPLSPEREVVVVNGLAASLLAQGGAARREEVRGLLEGLLERLADVAAPNMRLELVRSLQLLMTETQQSVGLAKEEGGTAPSPGSEGGLRRAISRAKERELLAPYLRRAAALLASVMESEPHREDALLCRVSLLERTQDEELRRLISPDGSSSLEILEALLTKHPDSEAARRAFVRLIVRPGAVLSADVSLLRRADRYAQELLAANPDDDHDLMLCLVCREQLIRFLLKSGDVEGAARERESLRGVVQLMTSREDFPQDSRRQLLELVDQMARPDASLDDHRSRLAEIINRHDEHTRRSMRRRFHEARRSRIWGGRSESLPQQAGH